MFPQSAPERGRDEAVVVLLDAERLSQSAHHTT